VWTPAARPPPEKDTAACCGPHDTPSAPYDGMDCLRNASHHHSLRRSSLGGLAADELGDGCRTRSAEALHTCHAATHSRRTPCPAPWRP
jgi:hypothetical protein